VKKRDALVDNAADARQVREGGKKQRLQEQRHLADVRKVLHLEEGQRLLWGYMEACQVFGDIDGPPNYVARQLGRRSVGLEILLDIIEAAPEVLVKLQSENLARENSEKLSAEKAEEQLEERVAEAEEEVGHDTE
jgi:hypothetical protein